MKKIIKIIFWIIWIGMLVFCHLGVMVGSDNNNSSTIHTGILLIVIWWLLTISVTAIVWRRQDRKKAKIQKEYEDKYVKKIEYNDEFYGKIILEHDLKEGIISGDLDDISFYDKKLDVSILNIDDAVDLEILFKKIKKFNENFKKLTERIYPEFVSFLQKIDNYDKDGNLFKVDEQFLRDNFNFSMIVISEENIISIWGGWDSIVEQDFSINYNCQNDSFSFECL